jgi:hypothetical protein
MDKKLRYFKKLIVFVLFCSFMCPVLLQNEVVSASSLLVSNEVATDKTLIFTNNVAMGFVTLGKQTNITDVSIYVKMASLDAFTLYLVNTLDITEPANVLGHQHFVGNGETKWYTLSSGGGTWTTHVCTGNALYWIVVENIDSTSNFLPYKNTNPYTNATASTFSTGWTNQTLDADFKVFGDVTAGVPPTTETVYITHINPRVNYTEGSILKIEVNVPWSIFDSDDYPYAQWYCWFKDAAGKLMPTVSVGSGAPYYAYTAGGIHTADIVVQFANDTTVGTATAYVGYRLLNTYYDLSHFHFTIVVNNLIFSVQPQLTALENALPAYVFTEAQTCYYRVRGPDMGQYYYVVLVNASSGLEMSEFNHTFYTGAFSYVAVGNYNTLKHGTYFIRLRSYTTKVKLNESKMFNVIEVATVNSFSITMTKRSFTMADQLTFTVNRVKGSNAFHVLVIAPDKTTLYEETFDYSPVSISYDLDDTGGVLGRYQIFVVDVGDVNTIKAYDYFDLVSGDTGGEIIPGLSKATKMLIGISVSFLAGVGLLILTGNGVAFGGATAGFIYLFSQSAMGPLYLISESTVGAGIIVILVLVTIAAWLAK